VISSLCCFGCKALVGFSPVVLPLGSLCCGLGVGFALTIEMSAESERLGFCHCLCQYPVCLDEVFHKFYIFRRVGNYSEIIMR